MKIVDPTKCGTLQDAYRQGYADAERDVVRWLRKWQQSGINALIKSIELGGQHRPPTKVKL